MSMTSPIVVCGGDYEYTLGITGMYAGVHLAYEPMRVQDIFVAMLESRRFEACEFSLANYLTLRASGQHWLTAVPVFLNRAFRHALAVTRRDSALTSLAQLAGKRVGVEDYSMTAAVWFRGLLREEYGVDHRAITWVTRPKQRFPFPDDATVETNETPLEDLLSEGHIDALLAMSLKDSRLPAAKRRLRPILQNPQADEQAYYERTSIYPINHCVVIRNDVLEKHPAVVDAIYSAYALAKERAYARQLGTTLVPWGKAHWARSFEIFGGDPLSYGLTPVNRMVVERLALYLQQQGFIAAAPDIDALFALPTPP